MTPEGKFKKRFKESFESRMKELNIEYEIIENKSNKRSTPDTIFLGPKVWATIDFKKSSDAAQQPNQDFYVEKLNRMCYAAFVSPENAEDTLNDLERLFTAKK